MRLFHIMDCPFPIGILLSFLGSVSFWFLNSHECGHLGSWHPDHLGGHHGRHTFGWEQERKRLLTYVCKRDFHHWSDDFSRSS